MVIFNLGGKKAWMQKKRSNGSGQKILKKITHVSGTNPKLQLNLFDIWTENTLKDKKKRSGRKSNENGTVCSVDRTSSGNSNQKVVFILSGELIKLTYTLACVCDRSCI